MILVMLGPWQILLGVFGIILPIIALVDIVRNEFTGSNKIIWVLIVLFFNFIGSILYFKIGRKQRLN